jgi:hypothetical protein
VSFRGGVGIYLATTGFLTNWRSWMDKEFEDDSQEANNYLKEDDIEEKRMLDNLDWVLRFMRTFEKKKDDFRKRMEFRKQYL